VRIQETRSRDETVIRVDGWLQGSEEAAELIRVVRAAAAPVAIDLQELRSADPSGVAALRALSTEGARIRGASDFIKLLLDEERRLRQGAPR
jgi:hypothetical protein